MNSDRNPEEDGIPFRAVALDALRATAAPQLVVDAPAGAVVLERIARGAGATRWFRVGDERDLEQLAGRLSPGSAVSFYFDGRLASRVYDLSVGRRLLAIAAQDGDAVIGRLGDDQFEINVEFVSGPAELEEYASELPSGAEVIYGRFPGRDNDGLRAVTIDLPDRDGVVRPHPH
jgi:hypothetical protein